MRAYLKSNWAWCLAAALGVLAMTWAALYGFAWNDYDAEASAAFRALSHGDIGGFLSLAPAYGGSFILRAPFAGVTAALGGGDIAVYRAVSVPCLIAGAILGLVLVQRLAARGATPWTRVVVLGLCVCNPLTVRMLELGHPEEMLAAVLAIGAVLAAGSERPLLAAALLGFAVATKAWAVLAIGPVLLALPHNRVRVLFVAGGIVAAVYAPLLLAGSPHALLNGAAVTGQIFMPQHIFWPLGDAGHVILSSDGIPRPVGWRLPPEWLSPLTHPLIAFLVIPFSLFFRHRTRAAGRASTEQVLGLLALLLLLRCMLDPWNVIYYEVPFILALVAWESLRRPHRPPALSLALVAVVWATFEELPRYLSPDMMFATYCLWALPLAAWLAREVFAWPSIDWARIWRRSVSSLPANRTAPGSRA